MDTMDDNLAEKLEPSGRSGGRMARVFQQDCHPWMTILLKNSSHPAARSSGWLEFFSKIVIHCIHESSLGSYALQLINSATRCPLKLPSVALLNYPYRCLTLFWCS